MRRWLRWVLPIALACGAVAGAATVWLTEARADEAPPARDPGRAITPVLSVRRVPTVVAAPIAARRLRTDLDALMPRFPPDTCLVVEGPDLRYEHGADLALVPASTEKLLTATGALLALGPDARLRTIVASAARPAGGVIAGDLHLVGGGDPLLATADYVARFRRQPQVFTDLDALAASLQEAGIRRVDGAVVGEDSRYDPARYVAGWPARYVDQHVIGPLSALAVNDGFSRYPTRTDPDAPIEAAADPPANAAAVLTRLLEARGVDVVGEARSGPVPFGAAEVAAVQSLPLREVVAEMLRESDNSTAELLVKEIGRDAGEPTTAGGVAALRSLLEEAGVDLAGSDTVDGSGLSLDDRVSCDLLVDLLQRDGTGEVIAEGLAVAGRTGTLAERFVDTPLEGVLRAKTGSLTSVASLAGLVDDDDPPLTFALVVNVPPPGKVPDGVDEAQAAVAQVLASWPRTPDATVLGPVVEGG